MKKSKQLMSRFDSPKRFKWFEGTWSDRLMQGLLYLAVTFLLSLLFFGTTAAHAQPASALPEGMVLAAIMGEARGEGSRWDDWQGKLTAMTALAEAIRNRGTLKGVYGKSAVNRDPAWVQRKCEGLARKAWKASEHTNLTKGATHWENVGAFGSPWWARSLRKWTRSRLP